MRTVIAATIIALLAGAGISEAANEKTKVPANTRKDTTTTTQSTTATPPSTAQQQPAAVKWRAPHHRNQFSN